MRGAVYQAGIIRMVHRSYDLKKGGMFARSQKPKTRLNQYIARSN
jgi:hypothetical protein